MMVSMQKEMLTSWGWVLGGGELVWGGLFGGMYFAFFGRRGLTLQELPPFEVFSRRVIVLDVILVFSFFVCFFFNSSLNHL